MLFSHRFTVTVGENNPDIFIIKNIAAACKINRLFLFDFAADYNGTNAAVVVPIAVVGIIDIKLVGMAANHNFGLHIFSEKS